MQLSADAGPEAIAFKSRTPVSRKFWKTKAYAHVSKMKQERYKYGLIASPLKTMLIFSPSDASNTPPHSCGVFLYPFLLGRLPKLVCGRNQEGW